MDVSNVYAKVRTYYCGEGIFSDSKVNIQTEIVATKDEYNSLMSQILKEVDFYKREHRNRTLKIKMSCPAEDFILDYHPFKSPIGNRTIFGISYELVKRDDIFVSIGVEDELRGLLNNVHWSNERMKF